MKNKNKSSHKHNNTRTEDVGSLGNNFRACGIGVLTALLSLALLAVILSAIALLYDDPNKLLFPLSVVALCVSSAVGGFIGAKKASLSPLLSGIFIGILLLVVYMFLSFVLKAPRASSFIHILSFRLSVPVMSTLGAYLSVKRSHKKKHRR